MKVQCNMVIQGRNSLEAIKTGISLHIYLREKNEDRKNRNKSITILRIHIEGLLTELMIAEMKSSLKNTGEWRIILWFLRELGLKILQSPVISARYMLGCIL